MKIKTFIETKDSNRMCVSTLWNKDTEHYETAVFLATSDDQIIHATSCLFMSNKSANIAEALSEHQSLVVKITEGWAIQTPSDSIVKKDHIITERNKNSIVVITSEEDKLNGAGKEFVTRTFLADSDGNILDFDDLDIRGTDVYDTCLANHELAKSEAFLKL